MLGPETTLILMSIGGSTSYTATWWGQGRWPSMCRRVIDDAVAAGLPLPQPYDQRGSEALLADLDAPDEVPAPVLDWLIDLPGPRVHGPRGLRMHHGSRPSAPRTAPRRMEGEAGTSNNPPEQGRCLHAG